MNSQEWRKILSEGQKLVTEEKENIKYIGVMKDRTGKVTTYVGSIENEKNGWANGVQYKFMYYTPYGDRTKKKGWVKVIHKKSQFGTNNIEKISGNISLNIKDTVEN